MSVPDFRPDPTANNNRCSVHIGNTPCKTPAAWHINLGRTPDGAHQLTLACNPHMNRIRAEHVYAGRHPHGPACGETPWERCSAESTWQAPDGDGRRSLGSAAGRAAAAMGVLGERLAFDLHPDLQSPDEEPTP